jgi:quercetin dioxygenase-like cupin family protein
MKLRIQSFAVSLQLSLALTVSTANAHIGDNAAQVREAFSQPLPKLDGTHLKLMVVEVTFPPGGFSSPHAHTCPVFVYVIAGAIRCRIQGEPEKTYHAGESFYEAPNRVHAISANASKNKPAKFLAYFVCDHEGDRTIPVNEKKPPGGPQ